MASTTGAPARLGTGTSERRLAAAGWLLLCGWVGGMALSHPLWRGAPRVLPPVPALEALAGLSPAAHVALSGAVLAGALALALGRAVGGYVQLAALAVLVASDVTHGQPWAYLYALGAFALTMHRSGRASADDALLALRLMLAGLYLWSGLFKLNKHYLTDVSVWFFSPVAPRLPSKLVWLLTRGSPFYELGLGLGLLALRDRRAPVVLAVAQHAFVMALLGIGHRYNYVVLPWNAVTAALVAALCWPTRAERTSPAGERVLAGLRARRHALPRGYALVCCVLPGLSFAGAYPDALSFKLYHENNPGLWVRARRAWVAGLPPGPRAEFSTYDLESETADLEMVLLREAQVPLPRGLWALRAAARELVRRDGCEPFTGFELETTISLVRGGTAHEVLSCEQLR